MIFFFIQILIYAYDTANYFMMFFFRQKKKGQNRNKYNMSGQSSVVIIVVPGKLSIIAWCINVCITIISRTAGKMTMQVTFAKT